MISNLQKAYVIHSRPYKETSLIVTFLTENKGKITAVAKGAKRKNSRLSGNLEPFQCLNIDYRGKSDLKSLILAEPCEFFEDFFNFPFNMPSPEPSEREFSSLGSGFVISADGFIVTNNHVVENASEVSVSFQDGRVLEAKVIGTDPQTDLAVLKVEGDESFPFAIMADSEQIEVGDVVFAIGNPLGVGQTVTMGIVSAKGRNDLNMIRDGFENFIQTDASINQGNSGGALVDAQGRLLSLIHI